MSVAAAALAIAMPVHAYAAQYIVDTGEPAYGERWYFHDGQYFAGRFSTDGSYTISGASSHFSNRRETAGTVTVALYGDNGGNIPAGLLYSKAFTVGALTELDWFGIDGLDWDIGPGTYWIAFEPDASVWGWVSDSSPAPLSEYAQNNGNGWLDLGPDHLDYLRTGFRITGEPASVPGAVPEPATWAMSILGFAVAGAAMRRRRSVRVRYA
jgi:hypothetical protein